MFDHCATPTLTLFHAGCVSITAPINTLKPGRTISNYIHYKVWDEITYPFLNFNGATVEV